MSASPTTRYASRSEAIANGWFSRRNRTNEMHLEAQARRAAKEQNAYNCAIRNRKNRTLRTNEQQIAMLDGRLGKGQGAKKERARLAKLK